LSGVAGLSVVFGVLAWHVRADYSFLENLTNSSEAYRTMRVAEKQFGGAPILQVLVQWPENERLSSEATFDVLAEVHRAIENSAVAKSPVSIHSLLASLGGEREQTARFDQLKYVPADRLRSVVNEDQRLALVSAYAPDAGAASLRKPLDELSAELQAVQQRHPGFHVHVTGFAILATYRTTPMIMNLLTGLSLELIVIGAVISLVLRSLKLGAISLPSNVFPLLATAAALVIFGWPLQYASVLAFNICLGIAVDDTVHFLSRFQRELAATGDRQLAVRNSFRAVGPVMVTQTVLMISGFGAGLFCTIPTIRAFSACSCTALLLALASEMLIMPALLICLPGVTSRNKSTGTVAPSHRQESVSAEDDVLSAAP
jgi:predicted RND superfamily exporter protein